MELLKDYDMNVHYHPGNANVVADVLSRMSMVSTAHVEDERLGERLVDSTSGGVSVHSSSESSTVVEVKEGQHLDPMLMELKDSVLVKMNESLLWEIMAY